MLGDCQRDSQFCTMGRPRKAERFKLTQHTDRSGNKAWLVSGTRHNGERIRRFFTDRPEALREVNDLEAEEASKLIHSVP